jgi:hypothetical protein
LKQLPSSKEERNLGKKKRRKEYSAVLLLRVPEFAYQYTTTTHLLLELK